MYFIYQNKYSNYLNLNLINVKYATDRIIINNDFGIKLSDNYTKQANDLIVYKLHLFLSAVVCQNQLKDKIVVIDTNTFQNGLKIGKKRYIVEALEYLKHIEFKYTYYIRKNEKTNEWQTEIRQCKIVDDYVLSKGYVNVKLNADYIKLLGYKIKTCKERQYIELPSKFFTLDIKNYRHSVYLAYYILLNKKRNYSKARQNIVSIKELVKYCPTLKTYDKLGKQKQVSRTIIEPFKNNMKYLATELGFKWNNTKEWQNYLSFINDTIVFDFNSSQQ